MKSPRIHLVFRQPTKEELSEISSDLAQGGVLCTDLNLSIDSIPLPDNLSKRSSDILFNRVQSILHESIAEHKSLLSECAYREFYPLYILRSNVFRACLKPFFELSAIEWLNSEYRDHGINVYSDCGTLSEVDFDFDVKVIHQNQMRSKELVKSNRLSYVLVFASRFFVGMVQSILPKRNKYLLWYTDVQPVPIMGLDGKARNGDPIFEYLLDRVLVDDDFGLISVLKNFRKQDSYSLKNDLVGAVLKKRGLFFEFYFGLAILGSFLGLNDVKLYRQKIRRVWNEGNFEQFNRLDRLILNSFRSQSSQLVLMAMRFEASRLLLRLYKPKAIGGGNELSFTKYPIVGAAKGLGVKTYGIQHGGISSQNVFYSYLEADKSFDPLPDLTLTWGDYVIQRLCEKSIYNRDQLGVVGQIRTDVIPSLKKLKQEDSEERFTILYCGQPLPHLPIIRENLLRDVFRLQSQHPEFEVLIKPHPREMSQLEWIRGIAQSENTEANFRTDDLYLLLSKSNVVITYYSTAGAEAIYFDKELIVFDYDGADIARYHELGVGHLCTDYISLENTINEIRLGVAPDLSMARERFREERAFKIDGQTVARTIDAIKTI